MTTRGLPQPASWGDGLPKWTQANRSIVDTDVVVWYTMGSNISLCVQMPRGKVGRPHG